MSGNKILDTKTGLRFKLEVLKEMIRMELFGGVSREETRTLQDLMKRYQKFREDVMNEVKSLREEMDCLEEKAVEMNEKLDSIEQRNKMNYLLVFGIPETEKEESSKIMNEFIKSKLKVSLDSYVESYRIGAVRRVNYTRPRPMIVHFVSYQDRERVWKNRKVLKGSTYSITEYLTPQRRRILKGAKQLAGPRNVWTQYGKIVVRRDDGTTILISSQRDFENLCRIWVQSDCDKVDFYGVACRY